MLRLSKIHVKSFVSKTRYADILMREEDKGAKRMIDPLFKQESDRILADRMAQYKHWTSIAGRNKRKGELSWYLNKRDRPHVQLFQEVREIETQYATASFLATKDGETFDINPLSNPDILNEEDGYWAGQKTDEDAARLSDMTSVMTAVFRHLPAKEAQAFTLLRRGMGTTEIAKTMGIKQGTASKLLQRIQKKMRAAHDVKAKKN